MAENQEPIIAVEDLVVRYGDRTVLDGVNFDIREGEVFVILGGSGSGKTTLLRNLVGLMRPAAGRILIKGEDFTAMTEDERIELRKKMGMSFQGSALLQSISVADNVALPLREHTELEESTIDIMTRIKLELVGLGGFENYLPSELSGGMKKRAGIARAMAMDPEFIFYDEPSAGLDPIVAAGIDQLIRKLQETFKITSVVVTHEMESVELIADRVCMLKDGQVVDIGTYEELEESDHPYVQQFFARRPDDDQSTDAAYTRALTGQG
ncbi:MAG: ABC transporter ATP-binding protein [Acidobacteria bacterium]|jgi:phospholipid/cholesterol/gamma-HCH transport system ATP-binding protein|nr:ABC transporter ATP-binding protein [Acidobacteriota bacterium]